MILMRLMITIMITWLNSNCVVKSLWLRKEYSEDDDEEDYVMSMEDQSIGDLSFNSRGPKSLYRGLENDSDFLWDYGMNYNDFDFEYDTHF